VCSQLCSGCLQAWYATWRLRWPPLPPGYSSTCAPCMWVRLWQAVYSVSIAAGAMQGPCLCGCPLQPAAAAPLRHRLELVAPLVGQAAAVARRAQVRAPGPGGGRLAVSGVGVQPKPCELSNLKTFRNPRPSATLNLHQP
jgi:hypothetical protein